MTIQDWIRDVQELLNEMQSIDFGYPLGSNNLPPAQPPAVVRGVLNQLGQTRLRANLKEVPPTSKAYKRYIEKFDLQETEIEQFREKIKNLQKTEFQQKRGLDNYLAKLTIN